MFRSPAADGTASQVIVTDGSGSLSFASASSSLGSSISLTGGSGWAIGVDGSNNLTFSYGGDVKMRITAAGALDVEDDITAFSGV